MEGGQAVLPVEALGGLVVLHVEVEGGLVVLPVEAAGGLVVLPVEIVRGWLVRVDAVLKKNMLFQKYCFFSSSIINCVASLHASRNLFFNAQCKSTVCTVD